jgi:site-specific DNA recombinase
VAKKLTAPENTAVIYARYSSSNQREESIEAQVRACQDYAQRGGLKVIGVYADSAKTGTNAEREQFQKMIDDSSKGQFRYVIIHKLDRFSRDRYDSVTFKRKLKINGVTLRSVLENLDGSPESLILESMLEGMAAYYSQNLSRECLKGQLENGYKCVHNGGIPPLGYDVDMETRKCVVNEKEAEIVRYIFSQYADGVGYNRIIAHLNDMGWLSKRGKIFGKNSLHDLLKNPKYMGIYTFNMRLEKDVTGSRNPQFKPKDEWVYVEGGMPAIVDKEMFERVQVKIAHNKKIAGCFKTKRIYLLAGLLKCGECGASMWGKSHTDGRHGLLYLNYECCMKTNKQTCRSKGVKKESIENYVLDELQSTLFSENSIKKLASMLSDYSAKTRNKSQMELEGAIHELDEIKTKIDRIIQLVADSGISIDTVKGELKRLEERKMSAENYIQEIQMRENTASISEEMIIGMINKSKELVKAHNILECRNIIGNYVESVTVHREKVEIKFKIGVPCNDNGALCPLSVERDLEDVNLNSRKITSHASK